MPSYPNRISPMHNGPNSSMVAIVSRCRVVEGEGRDEDGTDGSSLEGCGGCGESLGE